MRDIDSERELREIDAQVAENVFSHKVFDVPRNLTGSAYRAAREGPSLHVERYTTDWAAAGLVVEKMRERGIYLTLTPLANGAWAVDVDTSDWPYERRFSAPTAPLAICRAALRVVEATQL